VIYVAPLGIAVCYFTIAFLLGGGFGDADADVDVDAGGVDVDADADVDLDAAAHAPVLAHGDETEFFADGPGDHDFDADSHADADAHSMGLFAKFFIFMGVGKVPLSLIWSTFFITWGLAGITCNTLLYIAMGPGVFYRITWFVSIPAAFTAAMVLTKGVVQLWIKFIHTHEPTASRPRDLVGARGSVLSETVTDDHGRARITDSFGFSLDIFCKRHPTCRRKLKYGDSIMVIDMVPGQNYYFVGPFDDGKTE